MTTAEQRAYPFKVDALLDLRVRLADERIMVEENSTIAEKQRAKVFLTGVAQGLDTALTFVDEALEAA